jgi:hypothetical protein
MATRAPMRAKAKVITLIGPIAQPDDGRGVDAVQQFSGLLRIKHRGFSGLHHMLGATNGMRRASRTACGRRPDAASPSAFRNPSPGATMLAATCRYAAGAFLLRMVTAKNSRNRFAAGRRRGDDSRHHSRGRQPRDDRPVKKTHARPAAALITRISLQPMKQSSSTGNGPVSWR